MSADTFLPTHSSATIHSASNISPTENETKLRYTVETELPFSKVYHDYSGPRQVKTDSKVFVTDADWLDNRAYILDALSKSDLPKGDQSAVIDTVLAQTENRLARAKCRADAVKENRMQRRVDQLRELKAWISQESNSGEKIKVVGFYGWGEHALKIAGYEAKSFTNIGQYDTLIYKDSSGILRAKRLNATIAMKPSLENCPQDYHLRTKSLESHNNYFNNKRDKGHEFDKDGLLNQTHLLKEHSRGWFGILKSARRLFGAFVNFYRKGLFGISAASVTNLSAATAGFKMDGPDDCATLAKEGAEGIAQPLIHLGVLGAFYPFVAMGAKGLSEEHTKVCKNIDEIIEQLQDKKDELLVKIKSLLGEDHLCLMAIESDGLTQETLTQLYREINRILKGGTVNCGINSDSVDLALATFIASVQVQVMTDQLDWAKAEKKEIWLAKVGMNGMLQAMRLFVAEAGFTLASMLNSGQASSGLAFTAGILGSIGTGVMGLGQMFMMGAGITKTVNGIIESKQLRQDASELKKMIDGQPEDSPLKQMYQQLKTDKEQEAFWALMSQAIPGTSLAVGQALMLSWSVLSVVSITMIASGVAAPAGGAGLMLSLMVPGVFLTLASSLPGVGLESIMESLKEEVLGMHDEEDGFDVNEFFNDLLSSVLSGKQSEGSENNGKTASSDLVQRLKSDMRKVQDRCAEHFLTAQNRINSIEELNEAFEVRVTAARDDMKKSRLVDSESLLSGADFYNVLENVLPSHPTLAEDAVSEARQEKVNSKEGILDAIDAMKEVGCYDEFLESFYERADRHDIIFKPLLSMRDKSVNDAEVAPSELSDCSVDSNGSTEIFDRIRVVEKRQWKKVFSWKNLWNPVRLRHTKLVQFWNLFSEARVNVSHYLRFNEHQCAELLTVEYENVPAQKAQQRLQQDFYRSAIEALSDHAVKRYRAVKVVAGGQAFQIAKLFPQAAA